MSDPSLLIDAVIINARYTPQYENDELGWYESGLVLDIRTADNQIYEGLLQCDPEGNGPGALVIVNIDTEEAHYYGKS